MRRPDPVDDALDREARFAVLFDIAYDRLWAYARRRVGAMADDVVAETLTIAWRRLDDIPSDPMPWLYGVARKVAWRARRSIERDQALRQRVGDQLVLQPTSEPDHDCPPILRALARLADRDRDAILLIAWEELNIADASQVLGCSEVAFRVRLHRARRRLRALLADLTADTTAARPLTPLAQGDEP